MADFEIKGNEGESRQTWTSKTKHACRLCLDEHDVSLINIFEERFEEGVMGAPMVQRLFDLFQINYEKSATLPNRICRSCLDMVDTFSKFRKSISVCEAELQKWSNSFNCNSNVNAFSSEEELRPGLNGNIGVFQPEEYSIINEVDPEQDYESSEDDFSMESDSESEESEMPVASTLLESVHMQQYHKQPIGYGTSLLTTSEVSHSETNTADNDFLSHHTTSTPLVESFVLEFSTKNTFLCQYCDMAFTTQLDCMEHEARHDVATPYICNFCPLRTANRPNLIYHIKEAHDADRPYVCTLCNKGFCRRSDLKKHTIVHTGVRPYTCPICSKSFSRNTNLTKHMRIHSSVKPHVCQRCPRSFSTANELLRHGRSHTEIKPFKCSRCSASFTRKDKLQLHEQAHYRRESEFLMNQAKTVAANAAVSCAANVIATPRGHMEGIVVSLNPYGESESAENGYRTSILATQLQQRPSASSKNGQGMKHTRLFNCNICSKSFTRERDLQRHQALHLDSLFTCKQCGIGFNRREKLARHEQEQHGPQYSCDICHLIFAKRDALESHMKMHELQQKAASVGAAIVVSNATTTPAAMGAVLTLSKDMQAPQRPSPADVSFYSQLVPTMSLGFYNETRPEERNNI